MTLFDAKIDAGAETCAMLELISFEIGGQEFCIDVRSVREIRGWTPATPIPQAPEYILGVINLRGAVMPVLDLRCRLGLGKTEPSSPPRYRGHPARCPHGRHPGRRRAGDLPAGILSAPGPSGRRL